MTQAPILAQADSAFNGNVTVHTPWTPGGWAVAFWESEFEFWRVLKHDATGEMVSWADGQEGNSSEACLRGVLVAAGVTLPEAEIHALIADMS